MASIAETSSSMVTGMRELSSHEQPRTQKHKCRLHLDTSDEKT